MARLRHWLSTLRPVGRPKGRKTRFWLPARLYQTGFAPAGFRRKVSEMSLTSIPPFPGLLGAGCVPWYVGFTEKELLPDSQLREWDDRHPLSRREFSWLPFVLGNAQRCDALPTPSPSRAACFILASSRSVPNTSASSASTVPRFAPSCCSPISTAAS